MTRWVAVEVERALYVDRGRTVVVCDRNILGPQGGMLLLKLKDNKPEGENAGSVR